MSISISNFISTPESLTESLLDTLYRHDPAGTFCTDNADMQDEYCNEAQKITALFKSGDCTLRAAMFRVMDDQFSGHFDDAKLLAAYQEIKLRLC